MAEVSGRILQEQQCVEKMIQIFCRGNHGPVPAPCPACRSLIDETRRRVAVCQFGENKPVCQECTIHCFPSKSRRKIQEVMRYSGPRIFFISPMDAITHMAHSSKVTRIILWLLGTITLIIGGIGIVIPGLPTTPFVLLAAFFFARSSKVWHNWLTGHSFWGPLILQWEKNKTLPDGAKRWALITLCITTCISCVLLQSILMRVVLLAIVTAVSIYISKIPTSESHEPPE